MKPKLCRVCKVEFAPFNSLQFACSVPCALEYSRKKREGDGRRQQKAAKAKERKSNREARVRLKTRSDYLKEAQDACNAYIRKRDSGLPCVSCGTKDPNIQYAAGHYRSVGACPELRYHPSNIWRQCNRNCNQHKSGSAVEYRIELVKRCGIDMVEWLEGPHQAQHYTIEDAKEIKAHYKQLLKEL